MHNYWWKYYGFNKSQHSQGAVFILLHFTLLLLFLIEYYLISALPHLSLLQKNDSVTLPTMHSVPILYNTDRKRHNSFFFLQKVTAISVLSCILQTLSPQKQTFSRSSAIQALGENYHSAYLTNYDFNRLVSEHWTGNNNAQTFIC